MTLVTPSHDMLPLVIQNKVSYRQLHPALWSLYLMPQLFPVEGSNPHHMSCVRRLRKYTRGLAWPAVHAHCLMYISVEADLVKEICEDVEFPLKLLRRERCHQSIVRIE